MLIPYLWRLKEWSPILVDTGVGCKEKFTSSILGNDKGKICFEDKQYHLLRTDGACMWSEQRVGISRTEAPKKLANFPGLDKLTGKDYGGLTKEDIVARYVCLFLPPCFLTLSFFPHLFSVTRYARHPISAPNN